MHNKISPSPRRWGCCAERQNRFHKFDGARSRPGGSGFASSRFARDFWAPRSPRPRGGGDANGGDSLGKAAAGHEGAGGLHPVPAAPCSAPKGVGRKGEAAGGVVSHPPGYGEGEDAGRPGREAMPAWLWLRVASSPVAPGRAGQRRQGQPPARPCPLPKTPGRRDRRSASAGPRKQPSRSHVESPPWLPHHLTPVGASPVGRAGTELPERERGKSGAGGGGRDAGDPGGVCAGDTEPFAAPPSPPLPGVCSLRAAGHGWQKSGGGGDGDSDTSRGGALDVPHPPGNGGGHPGTGARGEGRLGQAGNFHPPGIN